MGPCRWSNFYLCQEVKALLPWAFVHTTTFYRPDELPCSAIESWNGNSKITSRLLSGGPLHRASREACAKVNLLVLASHAYPLWRKMSKAEAKAHHGVVWDQGEPTCSYPGVFTHIVFNVIGGLPCGDLVDCWCVTQHAFGLDGKVTGHSGRNRGTPETISVYNMNVKRPQINRPTSVQFQSHWKAFPAMKICIYIYIFWYLHLDLHINLHMFLCA